MRALIKIHYNDFNDMSRYMWEAIEMSHRLADIGNPIEDKLLTVVILAGFSFEYKSLVMALDGSEAKITTELVKNKLLQDDIKKKGISTSNEIAYASRSDQRHFPQKFQKGEVICYGCNKKDTYQ